jgi:ankyrin repeat protein
MSGPNTTDQGGRIPLHYAASENDADKARSEIAAGADVDKKDNDGFTPLHFAALEGATETAAVLLDAGAAVDPQNKYGKTPLGVALTSSTGTPAVLKLLRSRGADPFIKNNNGKSPADTVKIMANEDKREIFADILGQ